MRIYTDCRELMSEMGRDLWEMGTLVKPNTYQNKVIKGKEDFFTKELICKQYCLTSLDNEDYLFAYTNSKDWAEAEFRERVAVYISNPGMAWEKRPEIWEQFLVNGQFEYTYQARIRNSAFYKGHLSNILDIIEDLLVEDPDTRKAVLPIFGFEKQNNPDIDHLDGSARIPCSMYYDFLLRNNHLNITYHQRSSDFVQHFGNDVYLAWKLMEHVVNEINYSLSRTNIPPVKPGYLYHTIDSLHSYQKDWIYLKSNIDELVKK